MTICPCCRTRPSRRLMAKSRNPALCLRCFLSMHAPKRPDLDAAEIERRFAAAKAAIRSRRSA